MTDTPAGAVIADRYELHELLGTGGAGRVFAATDQRLRRRVAIKLVPADQARSADPASTARFVDEARTGARFSHPNAVTVYDAGSSDGYLYLVTELVEGTNLAEHLAAHGPLGVADALRIADEILAALGAAHSAGIVHRDVKPSNVLLDSAGDAKLADFGIAKRLDDVQTSLTAEGQFVGTPRYAAPEQASGQPSTAATDVYASAVLIYEMLSGVAPYEGDTAAVALAHQTAPIPDIRSARPDVSPQVAAVLQRALAKAPADRFPDAAAFASALRLANQPAPAGSSTRAYPASAAAGMVAQPPNGSSADDRLRQMSFDEPPSRSRSQWWWWAGAGALLAVAIGAGVLADRDGDGDDTGGPAGGGTVATGAAAPAPRRSTTSTTVVASTTAVPTTTLAPTTAAPTTLPPTTLPPTTLPPPTDLAALIGFVAASDDLGRRHGELMRELDKLVTSEGNALREKAHKLAEKTFEWANNGELDPVLANYTIIILNEIVQPGNSDENGNDNGEGDGDD